MSAEFGRLEPQTIETIVSRTTVPESARPLWLQANRERRQLFDTIHEGLSGLPYNQSATSTAEQQAFHHLYHTTDDGTTWDRFVVIARKRHDDCHTIAWHVIVNDSSNVDGGRAVNYAEFVLPIGRRLMDFRYADIEISDSRGATREDLPGVALIQERADRFEIFRGQGSRLLSPPLHWQITEAPERYVVHDKLAWLLKGLNEIASSRSSFSPGLTGDII